MKEVYAIFDRRLSAYMTPMFAANDAVAHRMFSGSVLYHETPMQQFPADFELHGIGRFDELTGRFSNFEAPHTVTNAKVVIEEAHELSRQAMVEAEEDGVAL